MADSTHPTPPTSDPYDPALLTDLQVALPLLVRTGPTPLDMSRLGTLTATARPDGLHIGDHEIADALGKAAAVHRERAEEHHRVASNTADECDTPLSPDPVLPDCAQLQVLYLPEREGETGPSPFALVLSSASGSAITPRSLEALSDFARDCGARALVVTPMAIEIA